MKPESPWRRADDALDLDASNLEDLKALIWRIQADGVRALDTALGVSRAELIAACITVAVGFACAASEFSTASGIENANERILAWFSQIFKLEQES